MDTENHWKEKYGITLRPMAEPERMYAYTQSQQIMSQTGCIGHLRADMDTNGMGFFSSWDDHCGNLKTPEFKTEFDTVINAFRKGFLANRSALSKAEVYEKLAEVNAGLRGLRGEMKVCEDVGIYRSLIVKHIKNSDIVVKKDANQR